MIILYLCYQWTECCTYEYSNLIMLISFSQVLEEPHTSAPSSSDGNVQMNLAQQTDPGMTNLDQLLG